ncbi:hypothetical protein A3F65_01805 [Candidatus Saccharibacteria bacterium RIFCSPHIGHO2_12_FULL_47_16b]|nr:MAG: hypothetical protein A3F65_01805 [Candidatus Saccharibacteria bacterium RIFCSPHIGHO2_12_FULL_47_16b]
MPAKIKTYQPHSHYHPYRPRGVSKRAFHQVYWPYLPLILIIGLFLGLGLRNSALPQAASQPLATTLSYADTMQPNRLIAQTNLERQQAQLPTLRFSAKLAAAAQTKADDMVSRNYWSHDTPDGSPPWLFVARQSYGYNKLGENLAAGFNDETSTVAGWMASVAHRDNILDPGFSEVGFGVAESQNYSSAGGGPMTVVVAFYAQPNQLAGPKISLVKGAQVSSETTAAQLAFANLPVAGVATNLAVASLLAAIFFWLSRHVRSFRRAVKQGEKFFFRHPLFDLGLLVIAAIGYLLTQTTGLIH